MVLGEGDYASRALARRAQQGWNFLLRASSLEQPIYAGDVIDAIVAAVGGAIADTIALDLAGPESLTRGELTRRAVSLQGGTTRIISLPLALGMLAAWVFEKISDNPPFSRAMLDVLDHDDEIDPAAALNALGISLTPLGIALGRCLSDTG